MRSACTVLGLSRATAYRRQRGVQHGPRLPRPRSHRRIADAERAKVVALFDSERFVDQPPREVYAALLSEERYECSIRTMYRILHEHGPVRERRDHREPRHHAVPRLIATAPNQVWSWDISKLATYERGVFLNLYVVLDLFSRFVVAWMIAEHENSALAKQLFREAIERYGIAPGTLTVHNDRGAPMTAHGFVELLSELGIDRSYSRPRVSDDNPFSESCFHTIKYQPDYPGRFRGAAHAREWFGDFFGWYHEQHHHEGLSLFTPAEVYFGHVERVAERRQKALDEAYRRHPERFVAGRPVAARPPQRVLLNPLDAAPPTVAAVLDTPDEQLAKLWPAAAVSGVPMINLPGANPSRDQLVNAT
jgi:putative transposase